jgi:L-alanine-DL-glutamate epimerase-like enolase superfamily enzyme
MSIPNAFLQEIFVSFIDRYKELLTDPINIEDGLATIPSGPGWGADIDTEVLEQYPATDFTQIESEPYVDF